MRNFKFEFQKLPRDILDSDLSVLGAGIAQYIALGYGLEGRGFESW
jgi:hypothetical protein